jgi:hypothetical protein
MISISISMMLPSSWIHRISISLWIRQWHLIGCDIYKDSIIKLRTILYLPTKSGIFGKDFSIRLVGRGGASGIGSKATFVNIK